MSENRPMGLLAQPPKFLFGLGRLGTDPLGPTKQRLGVLEKVVLRLTLYAMTSPQILRTWGDGSASCASTAKQIILLTPQN